MLREIDEQLDIQSSKLFVVPIGVGSLGEAVVTYSKAAGRSNTVLAVEPETAACLWSSLQAGENTTIETGATIMAGMHCETVSTTAWPFLKAGVDVSVTVSDVEAHEAVLYLQSKGVSAGPCGAATLAGLRYVARVAPEVLHLTPDAVVVLICSEGAREYEVPSKTAK
jgi:threonine dehydratase